MALRFLQNKQSAVLMTVGDPKKAILGFAAPIFLSQLFQQLYSTADAWIVSRFLGDDAFAAVSSSGSLIFLIISFFVGASMGAGVVISRYFGAGELEKMSRAVHTNVLVALICGACVSVFGVTMTPHILVWINVDPDILPLSTLYFRYYFMGAVAMVMYNSLKGVMNAVGDSRRPLFYLIFSSLLNISLDTLFVGVMGLGIEWAAIATTISQAASALLCLRQLTREGTVYRLSFRKLKIHGDILKEILRYGLPTAVQNSVIAFANVLVQSNVNTFGEIGMASWGAYSKIEGFAFLPITSFSMALTTYIGQNLGAKEYDRAKAGARFGIITSLVLSEITGLLIYLLARQLISFFISDPETVRWGIEHCRTIALFYFLLSFSHCIAGICRGAGRAFVPMLIMLSVWCVFRIIYITIAMKIRHDIVLLYWAYPITWGISSVIYLIYYLKSDWLHGFEQKSRLLRVKEKEEQPA
ncbi:MAG: MATE family efflux transporter [Lachnospiraceae bacterium]|nr:MATE family efflux transporter [Lachnospiraceae bacterium]